MKRKLTSVCLGLLGGLLFSQGTFAFTLVELIKPNNIPGYTCSGDVNKVCCTKNLVTCATIRCASGYKCVDDAVKGGSCVINPIHYACEVKEPSGDPVLVKLDSFKDLDAALADPRFQQKNLCSNYYGKYVVQCYQEFVGFPHKGAGYRSFVTTCPAKPPAATIISCPDSVTAAGNGAFNLPAPWTVLQGYNPTTVPKGTVMTPNIGSGGAGALMQNGQIICAYEPKGLNVVPKPCALSASGVLSGQCQLDIYQPVPKGKTCKTIRLNGQPAVSCE